MTGPISEIESTNLKTIKSIKDSLKTVSINKVLNRLGFTRQNLNKHLRKENAASANINILNRIIDAIAAEQDVEKKKAKKTLSKASKLQSL